MSNILIIKHGSLGDLIQANGAIKDIKKSFKSSKLFLLTTLPYLEFMSECPHLDGVILDKRSPRWNLFYLFSLKKSLEKYNFTHIFDLQNSSRTKFYKNFIIKNAVWSSSVTSLNEGEKISEFNKESVLDRMEQQLKKSNISAENVKNVDISWCIKDVSRNLKQYTNDEYILIFPFCSKKNQQKKWPYFQELIIKIRELFKNKYSILIAPGPNEIEEGKKLNAKIVLNDDKPVSIGHLISLIYNAKYVISNDTGPAHACTHLKKKGLVLFGSHTSPEKVNIGNNNFRPIVTKNLSDLKVSEVLKEISKDLN